jgi:hypothetical protein
MYNRRGDGGDGGMWVAQEDGNLTLLTVIFNLNAG